MLPTGAAAGRRPRVGFLAYGLDRPLSGVSRAALELGLALELGGECEMIYLTTYRHGPFRQSQSSYHLPGCARLPALMALGGPLIALAARRLRLDLVHDPSGISPFTLGHWAGSFKRVVSLYDAIAFRYPDGYPWFNNFLHRRYVPATLQNVDGILTVSEHAREELVHFLSLPRARIAIALLAASGSFRPIHPESARRVAARYGLEGPYILSVAAQQARKNLAALVAAFSQLYADFPSHRLAIAGPTLWRYGGLREQIAALRLEKAVTVLGYANEEDLAGLYGGADLFVFPSLYEGFGLPVLEAMACGTPVVCSSTTSLPEVTGGAALMVDPTSVEALAEAMARVLTDQALRRELRERGLARAGELTWERTARSTVGAYQWLLSEAA